MDLTTASALGIEVRRRRQASGLTQVQLAELAGVGRVFVSRLENGHRAAGLQSVLDVLGALGARVAVTDAGESAVDGWSLDEHLATFDAPSEATGAAAGVQP